MLIDKYLMGIEVEVDAISATGKDIPDTRASWSMSSAPASTPGDSIAVYPAMLCLTESQKDRLVDYIRPSGAVHEYATALINIQYVTA